MSNSAPRRRKTDLMMVIRQGDLGKHGMLLIAAILTYIPFYLLIVVSFKSQSQFYHSTWLPEFPLTLGNYSQAWTLVSRYILNSIFVTAVTVSGVLLISSLAAFAFARYSFPGKNILSVFQCLQMQCILTKRNMGGADRV